MQTIQDTMKITQALDKRITSLSSNAELNSYI